MYLIHKPGTGQQVQTQDFPLNSINLGKVFDDLIEVFKFDVALGFRRLVVRPNSEGRWDHEWVGVELEEWGHTPTRCHHMTRNSETGKSEFTCNQPAGHSGHHDLGGEGG